MKTIDEAKLGTDVCYRFEYLAEFMAFDQHDIDALHASAEHLAPLVPSLVDAVYEQLFRYSATKRHFVPLQSGYDGDAPGDIDSLTLDHEMIEFRKQHLGRYLTNLVKNPYDATMVGYLDAVGKMHTPKLGSRQLSVPLVQMNALMGFVADALIATVFALKLDEQTTARTIRAFNKVLWLQNDLINRHYAAESET